MPSKNIVDFAYQVRDYMRGAEVVAGKNLAYSQENNAVIATIENGKSYKVRWTGSATVTLKKNSASGTEVTSGSTSPLSFTADSDFDLYFGSSADVTEIMVYDGNETSDTYEPYYVPVKDRDNTIDVTSEFEYASGISGIASTRIVKSGKTINGQMRFNTPLTSSDGPTIMTVPTKYAPKIGIMANDLFLLSALNETWTGNNVGLLVWHDNKIKIGGSVWGTNKNVFVSFSYEIE